MVADEELINEAASFLEERAELRGEEKVTQLRDAVWELRSNANVMSRRHVSTYGSLPWDRFPWMESSEPEVS